MQQKTIIAVIGGTGKSGYYLVKELINQGFHFKMLIRNPEKVPNQNPSIEIIYGDAGDYESIRSLIKGCDAIISTLGLGIPASETSIFSQSSSNIIRAMNEYNRKRYIVITGLNVDTPFDNKNEKTKFGTEWMYANYPKSTLDRQLEYDLLEKSYIDWTLVRLPLIEQTDLTAEIKINLQDCPGEKISATALAQFLIDQLTDREYIRKAPFIANR